MVDATARFPISADDWTEARVALKERAQVPVTLFEGNDSARVAATQRRAIDLDGVALVAKPAEQRTDQGLVAEEVGPLGVLEIRGDDRGALVVALLHQLEEDVGLLGAKI